MSNRRRARGPQTPGAAITQWAAALDGGRIPGGCETCDAYQTVTVTAPHVTAIRVHHDDWCPTYRRIEARRANP
jgi:hypothetical protein